MKTLNVRCFNKDVHNNPDKDPGQGNILAFFKGNSIFIKCSDHRCSCWNRIRVTNQDVDFSKATFEQSKLPKNYHFDSESAVVVINECNK